MTRRTKVNINIFVFKPLRKYNYKQCSSVCLKTLKVLKKLFNALKLHEKNGILMEKYLESPVIWTTYSHWKIPVICIII